MLLTEDEAKKKWCPFVRNLDVALEIGGFNRKDGNRVCKCIASECMMWEWEDVDVRGCCGLARGK